MELRKDIMKLILKIEKPILGVLQAHNLVTRKSKNLATAELTDEAKVLIGADEELITDEWIQKWRSLWPARQKGDTAIIRKKLNRFLQEEEVSLEQIWKATQAWIADKEEEKYIGNANYFFYKQEPDGEKSRCRNYLNVQANEQPDELFGSDLIFMVR